MAVLMTAEVANQTQQGYDGMLGALSDAMRAAPGFVLHAAHPIDGGWRIIEVWESKDAANRFFATHVAPNLPQGVRPKRSVQELHSFVTP
jgi:quinol monooxygenase YgiN